MIKIRLNSVRLTSIVMGALCSLSLQFTQAKAQTPPAAGLQVGDTSINPSITAPLLNESLSLGEAGSRTPAIGSGRIQLMALLTNRGPQISNAIVWRIFTPDAAGGDPNLVKEISAAAPTVDLSAGVYLINSAFGLAHLTRTIRIKAGDNRQEKFVINAGGLRIVVKPSAENLLGLVNATFDLLGDEHDQFGNRHLLLSGVRPGRITRLNAGIYRIVSRLGDANAVVSSEVTVEAGKLTEATVLHEAAKVTFKLVQRSGGEALAGAQWIIMSGSGKIVKETAGALPTHILAPGNYTVSVRWAGRLYTRTFTVRSGENVEVEVVIR